MTLKHSICYEALTGLYYSTLLGGEFGNCHGQGKTAEGAYISLKIRVNQLRNKQKSIKPNNLLKF